MRRKTSAFRRLTGILNMTLAAALLCACTLPGNAAPVVKIGLIAPFEGLGRPLGYGVLPAVKAAIAEANESRALGRYRVALVALNDDLDPRTAEAQANAILHDPDILAVLGPWSDITAASAAGPLASAGVPLLPATVISQPPGRPAMCPPPAEMAREMLGEAQRRGARRVGLAGPPNDLAAALGQAVRGSGLDMAAENPDAVLFTGDAAAAADELAARRAQGWRGALIGGPDMARDWFIQRAAAVADGARALVCVPPDAADARTEGEVPQAALAGAGARLLMQALAGDIAAHGRPSRAGVAAMLAGTRFEPSMAWYQVSNGRWVRTS